MPIMSVVLVARLRLFTLLAPGHSHYPMLHLGIELSKIFEPIKCATISNQELFLLELLKYSWNYYFFMKLIYQ